MSVPLSESLLPVRLDLPFSVRGSSGETSRQGSPPEPPTPTRGVYTSRRRPLQGRRNSPTTTGTSSKQRGPSVHRSECLRPPLPFFVRGTREFSRPRSFGSVPLGPTHVTVPLVPVQRTFATWISLFVLDSDEARFHLFPHPSESHPLVSVPSEGPPSFPPTVLDHRL